jgi:anti-sigma factor RsiW
MNCAWVRERMLLYLAGELDPPQAARLIRHLESCAACAAMAERLAETAGQVEAALPTTIEPPERLDARVMEVVRGLPAPRRPWPVPFPRQRIMHRLALAGAALSLMVVSFSAGRWDVLRSQPPPAPMAAMLDLSLLGDAHRQSLHAAWASEAPATQPQQLSRALAPLLPFPVAVVDLPGEGMRLVSGRREVVNGVPVAVLRYEWRGQRVSLFQVDARKLSPPGLRQVVVGSDSYFVRKVDGLTYVTWPLRQTHCVMVAQAVPMHLLFRLACHTSEKLERT